MRRGIAIAIALWSAGAFGERLPTAVVWLDGPNAAVEEVERGLGTAKDVKPLDDAEVKRLLVEGGPMSRAQGMVRGDLDRIEAGRLEEAEELLLREVPTELALPLLSKIAAARAKRASEAFGPPLSPVKVRVESEPPGALVYVDLQPVGRTPIDLPLDKQPYRSLDIELHGYRKVHRVGTPPPGTLAVALARDDGTVALIDAIRAADGNAPEGTVAELGRRIGAARMLVGRIDPGKPDRVQLRVLDVGQAKWAKPAISVVIVGAGPRAGGYAGLGGEGAPAAKPAATVAAVVKPPEPVPAWKRWYTWVAGGVLVALVVGLVVANHIGSDSLTVSVKH